MNVSSRTLALAGLSLALFATLTGCSSKPGTTGKTNPEPPAPIALTAKDTGSTRSLRVGQQLRELFQAAEQGRFLEREIQLRRIQDLHDHHLVPFVAQVLEAGKDVRGLIEEITQHDDDAPAIDALRQVVEDGRQTGPLPAGHRDQRALQERPARPA